MGVVFALWWQNRVGQWFSDFSHNVATTLRNISKSLQIFKYAQIHLTLTKTRCKPGVHSEETKICEPNLMYLITINEKAKIADHPEYRRRKPRHHQWYMNHSFRTTGFDCTEIEMVCVVLLGPLAVVFYRRPSGEVFIVGTGSHWLPPLCFVSDTEVTFTC